MYILAQRPTAGILIGVDLPKISILMPCFNAATTLPAAIDSILAQTCANWELIIADDGSIDSSPTIAANAAATDCRIRLLQFPHRGVYSSLRDASALARADLLGQCDADDLLAPAAIAESLKAIENHPNCGVFYSDHLVLDAAGKVLGIGKRSQIPFSPQSLLTNFISFHFRIIRRDVFDQVGGFDTSYSAAGDYDLCLRLSEVTPFHHIPLPLYGYRVNPASISSSRRLEQIESSARAVRAALGRRGLSQTLELEVEISSKFTLREKKSP